MISFGNPIYVCTGDLWEPLFLASICLPNYLVFLPFILVWHNILKDPCKKMKISNLFYNYFLKCTLFSPIFMQTANAFYASTQMLKFKNDFTKPLSLQRDPEGTYYFRLFYFSKILTLIYVFLTKYSVFLMVLRENKILSQVWHTTLNLFTHNLNKHP